MDQGAGGGGGGGATDPPEPSKYVDQSSAWPMGGGGTSSPVALQHEAPQDHQGAHVRQYEISIDVCLVLNITVVTIASRSEVVRDIVWIYPYA